MQQRRAEVLVVGSAQEAIKVIEQQQLHLLISDINLPDEDGYGLIDKIRKLKVESAKLPTIAVTNFYRDYKPTDVLAVGFQKYLCKPVDPDELVAVVISLTECQVCR